MNLRKASDGDRLSADAPDSVDADVRRPAGQSGFPPLLDRRSDGGPRFRFLWPQARATRADRFPGSRIVASHAYLPGSGSSGCQGPWPSASARAL